jgi:hypothetical protein
MAAAGLWTWLAGTPLSETMRTATWLYPVVEIVHIAGFSVLVGSVVLFDLRVLGCAPSLPVPELGRHLLRWALASLLLVVPAGLLLFTAHPVELAANPVFQLLPYRTVASWDRARPAPPAARAGAALSILLWLGVISCGRLLAYV